MIVNHYPKTSRSERLLFRPLWLEDAAIWQTFLENHKATAHFPESMKAHDPLRGLHWVEKQVARYRDKQGGLMAVLDANTKTFIGQAGLLVQHIDGQTELEIGYHLFPEFWGNGFATETAIYFKNLAFNLTEVNSVVSYIEKNNLASQKVAERNGMRVTGQTTWHNLEVEIYRVFR